MTHKQEDVDKLRKLILTEVSKYLIVERIEEPSEAIFKPVLKLFKQETGINAGIEMPPLKAKHSKSGIIRYEISLEPEIKTALLKRMFKTLNLEIEVSNMQVGGYRFLFKVNYKHNRSHTQSIELGSIYFNDGNLTSKL